MTVATPPMAADERDLRHYLAGILDASLHVAIKDKGGKDKDKGEPSLRVIVRLRSEELLARVRSHFRSRATAVTTAKSGQTRAWAEFVDDEAKRVVKMVAKFGVVNRGVARVAYAFMKGAIGADEAAQLLEKECKATARAAVLERFVQPKKKKGDESEPVGRVVKEMVPLEEEVESLFGDDAANEGWLAGFLDAAAFVKPSEDKKDDGDSGEDSGGGSKKQRRRKLGRIVLQTRRLPRGLAVAGGIRKLVGAGKVLYAPAAKGDRVSCRVAFVTKRDIDALKTVVAPYATVLDFASVA